MIYLYLLIIISIKVIILQFVKQKKFIILNKTKCTIYTNSNSTLYDHTQVKKFQKLLLLLLLGFLVLRIKLMTLCFPAGTLAESPALQKLLSLRKFNIRRFEL